jgi:hypothetical protein
VYIVDVSKESVQLMDNDTNDTSVARYIHDPCNGMRTYAATDGCKAFRARQRRARSEQDYLQLEEIYADLAGLADMGDHRGLYERVLELAHERGWTLTAGPEPRQQSLIHTADANAEPAILHAEAPGDIRAADIVIALVFAELAHVPIAYGGNHPDVVRAIVAEATAYCVLRALGVCYHRCAPALALGGVSPEVVREWSSVVADLYSRLMHDLQA